MGNSEFLSLADAVKFKRLQDFIAQEEARGVGPVGRPDLDRSIAALIKGQQSEGRTLRSASHDDSSGKRTRQGSGRHTSR